MLQPRFDFESHPFKFKSFMPYEDSLLWQLSELYFKEQGQHTWRRSECPYVITSNLQIAYQWAWVVHAALRSAKELPQQIRCLEAGAGHGVFSLNFLKAFSDVCQLEKCDYFERLTYIISDFSLLYLKAISQNPLIKQLMDKGQVELICLDVTQPQEYVPFSGSTQSQSTQPLTESSFDIIFCNYVFDTLPVQLYRLQGSDWTQKWVQLESRPAGHSKFAQLAHHLYQVGPWILHSEFCEVDREALAPPWLNAFVKQAHNQGKTGLLPVAQGAHQAIDGFFHLLRSGGLLCISDKGFTQDAWLHEEKDFWPRIYGFCVTHEVNFPLVVHHLHQLGMATFLDPILKHELRALVTQKSPELTVAVRESFRYHFVTTNRNESQFKNHTQVCHKLLQGISPH